MKLSASELLRDLQHVYREGPLPFYILGIILLIFLVAGIEWFSRYCIIY